MSKETELAVAAAVGTFSGYINTWAHRKLFWGHPVDPDKSFAECCMLIVEEIAEAVKADREGDPPDKHCPEFTGREVELGDAIIRILDAAGEFGLNVADAMIAKMRVNETRPIKHGRRY